MLGWRTQSKIYGCRHTVHPLQDWMSRDDFALVLPYLDCDDDIDLAKLYIEDHAEIFLNTEIKFETPGRDVRRSEWFPEQSCIYRFHFWGVKTGVSIKFSTRPTDANCLLVRDALLSCLAKECKSLKKLSIHGYAIKSQEDNGFMGPFSQFDGPDQVFSSWADSDAVLAAFARAGHWKDSLQKLTIMNHAASVSLQTLRSLPTLPQNLQEIQVAHLPWEIDDRITGLLLFFPNLERLQVTCSNQFGMHYPFFGFQLWNFLESLHRNNPNIRSLRVVWNAVASVTAGVTEEQVNSCLMALRSLSYLDHLAIGPNVWDGTQDTKALAHGILRLLPATSIKELRIQTIPVLKDYLYEQLSREDCQLDLLDVTPYGTTRRRDIPLATLSKFAKHIHIPAEGDNTALDFVFLLRRFFFLSFDTNKAAPLWPLLLATVGNWKVGKGVSMPLNRRQEPTHWLTDKGVKPPTGKPGNKKSPHRLSLFYALVRERADVVCSGLQSQSCRSTKHLLKRAAQKELCFSKRAKPAMQERGELCSPQCFL